MSEILEAVGIELAKRFMAEQFPVWGTDGSRHMDRIETDKFPDPTIVGDLGAGFWWWKATQGAGDWGFADRTYKRIWSILREYNQRSGKFLARMAFGFWDYCASHYTGSAELFGAQQWKYLWNVIKGDPGEIPPYIDAEAFAPWGYLTWFNQSKPMLIARGWIKAAADDMGFLPGIYTNPGTLPFFGDAFKDCDLAIAWYNETKTVNDIYAVMKRCGWRGKLRFWQYGSDGDLDQNGFGDGLRLGMEEKNLDLDVFTGTLKEFSAYCGRTPAPVSEPEPPQVEDPVIIHTDEIKKMHVKNPQGLNIRCKPQKDDLPLKGWLPDGAEVNTIRKIIEGSNIWRERKEGGFVAEVYNNFTYLE